MEISRAELESRYRNLSDEELLVRLDAGELTDLALAVAQEECQRRGLTLDAGDAPSVAAPEGPLQIFERFLDPMQAQILTMHLNSEGVAAQCADFDTVYANGAFHASLAYGGVRVMVPQSQMADAARIHADLKAGAYALDDDFDPGPAPERNDQG
jgi:hypothetical protein